MEYKFSEGFSNLQPSVIREILKNSGDTIPLAAGNPAPDAFPVADVQRIIKEIVDTEPILMLQYGVSEGYAPIIEELKKLARDRYDAFSENDAVIVTSGAQQVMSLMSPGVPQPRRLRYLRGAVVPRRAQLLQKLRRPPLRRAVEKDGIDLAVLEQKLSTEKNVKFIYTIPNFQNPAGATMSLEKRKGMYELAKKYGVLIIEDNPYGDLRVSGEDIPTIKSMDTDGLVVYSGSFSKIVAPGIRVGFLSAPKEVVSKLVVAKQTQDVHTPLISQLTVYKWLTECDIEKHIEHIRTIYRRKLNLLCDCLDKELGGFLTYHRPEGGLFVWAKIRDGVDMLEFCKRSSALGVSVVPGNAFMVDMSQKSQYIRLNFSTPTDENIVKGVRLLAQAAKSFE